jgi:hypothetical protein
MGKFFIFLACAFALFSSACLEEVTGPAVEITPVDSRDPSVDSPPPKHYGETSVPTFVACPEDAKICPDGSVIERTPPECDFAPCPQSAQPTHSPSQEPLVETVPPEHYPETPKPTIEPICKEGDIRTATCPDGKTTYSSENCVYGEWVTITYFRDPCSPIHEAQAHEEDAVWVEIDPIQCLGNPWEQDWLKAHEDDISSYPKDDEFEIIKEFYNREGVTILDIKGQRKYEFVCLACDCPRGDTLYLFIPGEHVDKISEFGFKVSS